MGWTKNYLKGQAEKNKLLLDGKTDDGSVWLAIDGVTSFATPQEVENWQDISGLTKNQVVVDGNGAYRVTGGSQGSYTYEPWALEEGSEGRAKYEADYNENMNSLSELGAFPNYTQAWREATGWTPDEDESSSPGSEPFTYDYRTDPLYLQMEEMYTREGDRAMRDTLAEISARTGGLASSYATGAAEEANNYYMQQLADKIPELQQLAYGMYLDDQEQDWRTWEAQQAMEQLEYDRAQTERQWDYQLSRDAVADARYEDELAYERELANAQLLASTLPSNTAKSVDIQEVLSAYEFGLLPEETAKQIIGTYFTGGALPDNIPADTVPTGTGEEDEENEDGNGLTPIGPSKSREEAYAIFNELYSELVRESYNGEVDHGDIVEIIETLRKQGYDI